MTVKEAVSKKKKESAMPVLSSVSDVLKTAVGKKNLKSLKVKVKFK